MKEGTSINNSSDIEIENQKPCHCDTENYVLSDDYDSQDRNENFPRVHSSSNGMRWSIVFTIFYSVVFTALTIASLITQCYFLLPVITVMANGLVYALHRISNSILAQNPKKRPHPTLLQR